MKKFNPWYLLVLVPLLSLPLMGTMIKQNISVGGCQKGAPATPTSTDDDYWIFSGGKSVQVQFEPDYDGAGTTAEVTTYSCTEQDEPLSCVLYAFDSDYDGVPDTSILDGVSAGQRGLSDVKIAGYLRVLVSTAPLSTENAQLWLCGEDS